MAKIAVFDTEITILKVDDSDYISLTDMLKAKDGDFFVTDWLRNRNTLEYIGIWEKFNNPNFNYGEFATIRNQAGLNSFKERPLRRASTTPASTSSSPPMPVTPRNSR